MKILYKLVALKTIGNLSIVEKHTVNYKEVFKTENNKNRRFASNIAQKRNKIKLKCGKAGIARPHSGLSILTKWTFISRILAVLS